MELDTPDLSNEAIQKSLNWDGQPHLFERYFFQSKIM